VSLQRRANNLECVVQLLLRDHERRRKPNLIAVRGLCEQPAVAKPQAHLPRADAFANRHPVEEPAAADGGEDGRVERRQPRPEAVAQPLRVLDHVFLAQHIERGHGDLRAQRVSAVRRPVLARLQLQHDLVAGDDGRHRIHPPRQRLPHDDDIRLDVVPVRAQHLPRAADAGLDLVGDEQHVVLLAQPLRLAEVALRRDDDAGLALDGLDHERREVVAPGLEGGLERGEIAEGDEGVAGHEGAEVMGGGGVGGGGDGGEGAAPEVALREEHGGGVGRDALDLVRPLARKLDGGLAGLDAGVHGEDAGVAEGLADVLLELAEDVVVERAGRERQGVRLVDERLDDFRVRVALVDGGVGGEKVEVHLVVDVVEQRALAAGEDDGERVVVEGAELVLELHAGLAGGGERGVGRRGLVGGEAADD